MVLKLILCDPALMLTIGLTCGVAAAALHFFGTILRPDKSNWPTDPIPMTFYRPEPESDFERARR
jgi:hypothetical protein